MIVTSKCAIKNTLKLICFFQLFTYMSPQFFFSRHCHYTSYLTYHIIPHIYAAIILFFHPFLKTKTGSTPCKQNTRKCSGGDVRLFPLSESSRYRPVRTRSVTSHILAQQRRRNGTEDVTETFVSV